MAPSIRLLAAAGVVLTAAGCASASPTASPSPDVNSIACPAFESGINDLLRAYQADVVNTDDELANLDSVGLKADGAVAERIDNLITNWPDIGSLAVYVERRKDANNLIDAVARACEAEGYPVSPGSFVVD